ncbi:macro domain-containing protein [Candidatus Bathyarchaeota archaeon]|nr:MAG: macro domain-containing protein [Candidatus Bathyarchaeota archaeon]
MEVSTMDVVYKGVRVRVLRGDITEVEAEAVVNPANSLLIMGGGVAGAIRRRGGAEIEEEARRHAPLPVGEAIATGAGRLRARWVIHAPTMRRPAMRIGLQNVRKAMRAALRCASNLKARSIAFPGLGTGVGGVAAADAAEVMVEELKRHIDEGTPLREVLLIGFDEELRGAFERAVERLLKL